MAAALADVRDLEAVLGLAPASTEAASGALAFYLSTASDCIRRYTKQQWTPQTAVVEFRTGSGINDLALRERPVYALNFSGVCTANSAVVTGIASTAALAVGYPVAPTGANANTGALASLVPAATTILTVDSSSQVTLSAAVTTAGTFTFSTLDVTLDPAGAYGDGPGTPYQAARRLILGLDFSLVRDQLDGSSKSALLRRIGGTTAGGLYGWGLEPLGSNTQGALSARALPVWPGYPFGNLRVAYVRGFTAANLPVALTSAAVELAAFCRRTFPYGGQVLKDEALRDYHYSLEMVLKKSPDLGSVRQLLSTFREISC